MGHRRGSSSLHFIGFSMVGPPIGADPEVAPGVRTVRVAHSQRGDQQGGSTAGIFQGRNQEREGEGLYNKKIYAISLVKSFLIRVSPTENGAPLSKPRCFKLRFSRGRPEVRTRGHQNYKV